MYSGCRTTTWHICQTKHLSMSCSGLTSCCLWQGIGSRMLTCSDRRNPAQVELSYHTNGCEWVRKCITTSSTAVHLRKTRSWLMYNHGADVGELDSISETSTLISILHIGAMESSLMIQIWRVGQLSAEADLTCLWLQDTTCEKP